MKYQPINGWTKQTIIDHIKANFKGKATFDGSCSYLTPDGKKCAIGIFIPDGHEAQSRSIHISAILRDYQDLREKMPLDQHLDGWFSEDMGPLLRLQCVHDESKSENTLSDMLAWIEENVE